MLPFGISAYELMKYCNEHYNALWLPIESVVMLVMLIPANSHSAADHLSACCRSLANKTNRTTSSAKSKDTILKTLNSTLYGPWLCSESLSIEVMNRISDLTEFNIHRERVWVAMGSKFLLRLYKDTMGHNNGAISRPTPVWHLLSWATPECNKVQPLSRSFGSRTHTMPW